MDRAQELRGRLDPGQLRRELERLPAPRAAGSTGAAAAAAAIHREFRDRGWDVQVDDFPAPVSGGRGTNIVAVRPGTSPEAVVVVAHYDTVPGTGGADDNGSGVVALLALARLLAGTSSRATIVLAAVDHEEVGLLGSTRLVERLDRPVLGAIVLEMLAYSDPEPGRQRLPRGIGLLYPRQIRQITRRGRRADFTAVLHRRDSGPLARTFAAALTRVAGEPAPVLLRAPTDLPLVGPLLGRLVPFARDFGRSDHVPFWAASLPAVQVTDTADFRNPHYHRPGDRPETLDYERLADVVAATALTVEQLAR
jgi:Zn-dependent M28 family amino/carboxypeptidase